MKKTRTDELADRLAPKAEPVLFCDLSNEQQQAEYSKYDAPHPCLDEHDREEIMANPDEPFLTNEITLARQILGNLRDTDPGAAKRQTLRVVALIEKLEHARYMLKHA